MREEDELHRFPGFSYDYSCLNKWIAEQYLEIHLARKSSDLECRPFWCLKEDLVRRL